MAAIDTVKANIFSTPMPDMPPVLREISSGWSIIIITVLIACAAAVLAPVEEAEQRETHQISKSKLSTPQN